MVCYGVIALLTTLFSLYAAALDIANESPHALLPIRVRRHVCRMLRSAKLKKRQYKFRRRLLNNIILMFADQQLFTGIALLASGYIEISRGTEWSKDFMRLPFDIRMKEAHFHMVTYLSCLSCSAALAAMITLQVLFKSNRMVHIIRKSVLLVFFLLLAASISFSNAFEFAFRLGKTSVFHDVNGMSEEMNATETVEMFNQPAPSDSNTVVQIFFAFSFAFTFMYPFWTYFRSHFSPRIFKGPLFSFQGMVYFILYSGKPKNFVLGFIHMVVFGNRTMSFLLAIFYFIVSSVFVVGQKVRKDPKEFHCSLAVKSEWGFGQTLALFVLGQLLFSACHVYVGKRRTIGSVLSVHLKG